MICLAPTWRWAGSGGRNPRSGGPMKQLLLAALLAVSTTSGFGCSSSGGGNAQTGGTAGSSANTGGSTTTGAQGGAAGSAGESRTGGTTSTSTAKQIGDSCTADSQCPGQTELSGFCEATWPGGGYCTTEPCNGSAQCGAQGWCADDGTGKATSRCLVYCFDSSYCKSGYKCTRSVCIPSN